MDCFRTAGNGQAGFYRSIDPGARKVDGSISGSCMKYSVACLVISRGRRSYNRKYFLRYKLRVLPRVTSPFLRKSRGKDRDPLEILSRCLQSAIRSVEAANRRFDVAFASSKICQWDCPRCDSVFELGERVRNLEEANIGIPWSQEWECIICGAGSNKPRAREHSYRYGSNPIIPLDGLP